MSATFAPATRRVAWRRLSVRRMIEALTAADRRYRMNHHMRELDDRLLRDIGVTRADIAAEVRTPAPW